MHSILIVDDDSNTRELFRRALADEPDAYDIHEAEDAEHALSVLSVLRVAVVICDRRMPGKDGLWLIQQLRKLCPEVAIVIATGDDSILPTFTLQPGVIAYFVKPLDLDRLREAVREGVTWHQAIRSGRSLR